MAQLISPDEVINIAFTDKLTDSNLIGDHFIEIAQQEHIRPALAYNEIDATLSLYELIVTQNTADTLTAVNSTLLETYIKPCLAFYVKYELINDMVMQTTAQGIMINQPDGSVSASDAQRSDIKEQSQSHAKTLLDRMIMYIEDVANIDNYPLYNSGNNIGHTVSVVGGIII